MAQTDVMQTLEDHLENFKNALKMTKNGTNTDSDEGKKILEEAEKSLKEMKNQAERFTQSGLFSKKALKAGKKAFNEVLDSDQMQAAKDYFCDKMETSEDMIKKHPWRFLIGGFLAGIIIGKL